MSMATSFMRGSTLVVSEGQSALLLLLLTSSFVLDVVEEGSDNSALLPLSDSASLSAHACCSCSSDVDDPDGDRLDRCRAAMAADSDATSFSATLSIDRW